MATDLTSAKQRAKAWSNTTAQSGETYVPDTCARTLPSSSSNTESDREGPSKMSNVVIAGAQQWRPQRYSDLNLCEGKKGSGVVNEGFWTGPAKTITVANGLTFRSNFDAGNLMKVVPVTELEGTGTRTVYELWTARDCEGGPNIRRNSSWFYFGVASASINQTIVLSPQDIVLFSIAPTDCIAVYPPMRLMNLNNQSTLYKHGMTPVFRQSGGQVWARLKRHVKFEEEERHLRLTFQFRFTRGAEEVFFAFCFPHSYEDCQRYLECCEDQARKDGMVVQALIAPEPSSTVYYHRELLILTPEGRRVDLLTVTDCHGVLSDREPRIDPHLFPDQPPGHRPFEFEGKDVVFVSARVHPGETPSSFVFQGILGFLLDPGDPRAAELRRRCVFKLVPMLNPDGVAAGHFRQDSFGNNLNRHYEDPHPQRHASVYASKAIVMHHAARPAGRGRLTFYLDLHAHASTRGCFMYGNHLHKLEDQAENQLLPLLMTLYTPHFQFPSCNFSLKHMSRVDSGDGGLSAEGTGRVFYGRRAGVLRSYTLECNYNTGKSMCNHIPPANGVKRGESASPERKPVPAPRYNPETWKDVGKGFLKALLDVEGASVWSRLPLSRFKTLERARKYLVYELRNQPCYREQSLVLRRGASSTKTPPLPPSPLTMRTSENATSVQEPLDVGVPIPLPRKNLQESPCPRPPPLPMRPSKTSPPGRRRVDSRKMAIGKLVAVQSKTVQVDASPRPLSGSRGSSHRAVATSIDKEAASTSRGVNGSRVGTGSGGRDTHRQASHHTRRFTWHDTGEGQSCNRWRRTKNPPRSTGSDGDYRGRRGSVRHGRRSSRSRSRKRKRGKRLSIPALGAFPNLPPRAFLSPAAVTSAQTSSKERHITRQPKLDKSVDLQPT